VYAADAYRPMKSSFASLRPAVVQAGTQASQCLAPQQRGKVLAAFSRAIYFITNEDEIFWMVATDSPMHRRCVQISSALPGLITGSQFQVEDRHLRIDSDFVFDLEGLSPWSEPSIDPNQILSSTELRTQIDTVFSKLELSNAKGFGQLIPDILSVLQNQSSFSIQTDPILAFAQPHVVNLAHACMHHQLDGITMAADKLIGLGSGLTPSGDDFIGGLLFAHQILRTTYAYCITDELAMMADSYRTRTHAISFTLLKDLADGHAIEPLHHILNDLLNAKPFETIEPLISQLTQVGNSTGWDLLAGVLAGLLAVCQNDHINSTNSLHHEMNV
jgi:uncharacterized protein DUF2877